MADSMADHPVGMAYLLGDLATDRWATAFAGRQGDRRLISSMFDISPPTDCPVTWRQRDPVGMALYRKGEGSIGGLGVILLQYSPLVNSCTVVKFKCMNSKYRI